MELFPSREFTSKPALFTWEKVWPFLSFLDAWLRFLARTHVVCWGIHLKISTFSQRGLTSVVTQLIVAWGRVPSPAQKHLNWKRDIWPWRGSPFSSQEPLWSFVAGFSDRFCWARSQHTSLSTTKWAAMYQTVCSSESGCAWVYYLLGSELFLPEGSYVSGCNGSRVLKIITGAMMHIFLISHVNTSAWIPRLLGTRVLFGFQLNTWECAGTPPRGAEVKNWRPNTSQNAICHFRNAMCDVTEKDIVHAFSFRWRSICVGASHSATKLKKWLWDFGPGNPQNRSVKCVVLQVHTPWHQGVRPLPLCPSFCQLDRHSGRRDNLGLWN